MPRVRDYEQQTSAQTGLSAGGATAPAHGNLEILGAGIQQAGQTYEHIRAKREENETAAEVTKIHANIAQYNAQKTLDLANEANNADYNDPKFADKFMEGYTRDLSKLGEGITTKGGRNAYDRAFADSQAHFSVAAGTHQTKLYGIQAKENFKTTIDSYSSTLVTDPSQFDRLLKETRAMFDDKNSIFARVPADKKTELLRLSEEKMSEAAISGWMRIDPEGTKKRLDAGEWDEYLDSGKKDVLIKRAVTEIHGREVEQDRLDRRAEKAKKDADRETGNQFMLKMYSKRDWARGKCSTQTCRRQEIILKNTT